MNWPFTIYLDQFTSALLQSASNECGMSPETLAGTILGQALTSGAATAIVNTLMGIASEDDRRAATRAVYASADMPVPDHVTEETDATTLLAALRECSQLPKTPEFEVASIRVNGRDVQVWQHFDQAETDEEILSQISRGRVWIEGDDQTLRPLGHLAESLRHAERKTPADRTFTIQLSDYERGVMLSELGMIESFLHNTLRTIADARAEYIPSSTQPAADVCAQTSVQVATSVSPCG